MTGKGFHFSACTTFSGADWSGTTCLAVTRYSCPFHSAAKAVPVKFPWAMRKVFCRTFVVGTIVLPILELGVKPLIQEGAAYNGHFECVCYHPLFLFNQFGDCEGATLRPGNVHSADGWQELLEPVVKGYQKKGLRLLFRGDAAFAKPELYEYLEQGKIGYAIRLPANQVIQEQIQPLLERPTEWPSREPIVSYHDFAYQAQSWHLPRRVVAKVEWHQGELFPRVGFIVTNLSYPPKGIVRFYNGRGTAEQWIKEGKYALNWTRLSCHKFVANQVRLWLFVLTYNLGNFMRRLVLPEDMKHWTLTSLQTRLIKTGGRLVRHARRLVFQLAEVLVTREMLTGILERISRLRLAPG